MPRQSSLSATRGPAALPGKMKKLVMPPAVLATPSSSSFCSALWMASSTVLFSWVKVMVTLVSLGMSKAGLPVLLCGVASPALLKKLRGVGFVGVRLID